MKNRSLLIIFLTVLMDLIGFGIIIPLSPYLARQYGASAFQVGLLMAIYSGMQFIFSPLWGGLSDRWGRRPILLLSILGTAVGHFLFYSADTMFMLFFARFLAGIFSANISTAAAVIADVTPPQERSKNMGLIGAAIGLGFVIGPALGGTVQFLGERAPALVATMASGLNFLFAYFMLAETLSVENRRKKPPQSRIAHIIQNIRKPVIGKVLLAQFTMGLAMANMEASLFLFVADRFSWGMQKASYGFAYVGICIALTQGVLVRKALPALGERRVSLIGIVLFTLSFFMIGVSQWIWLLAIAMTILALGNGMAHPALNGTVSLLTSEKDQGEVLGISQSMQALARVIGPPIGGYLYGTWGQSTPFLFAGVMGAVALIGVFVVQKKIPNTAKA